MKTEPNAVMKPELLAVSLPEAVLSMKYAGKFEEELRLIDAALGRDSLPAILRERLELERRFAAAVGETYNVPYGELLDQLKAEVEGFDSSELDGMIADGRADFRLVGGELVFSEDCRESLYINTPSLTERLRDKDEKKRRTEGSTLLDDNIKNMKRTGSAAMRFRIRHTLTPDIGAVRDGERVRVHLPLPIEAGSQQPVEAIKLLSASHSGKISPPGYPQRTICFDELYRPGMSFSVEYEYENHAAYSDTYAAPLTRNSADGDALSAFLREKYPHIVFTPYLRALAEELRGASTEPLETARRFYDWITSNVRYSYMRPYRWLEMIPEYAALNFRGDCGVQALLFITLCRVSGIPAAWQSGMYVTPERVSSHDWARFYVEGRGWLFCDPSFGGGAKRAGSEERRRFYFGNLDPYRMAANSEFQHPFEVGKRFDRSDPYDNQSGEIECETRALSDGEFTFTREVISSESV